MKWFTFGGRNTFWMFPRFKVLQLRWLNLCHSKCMHLNHLPCIGLFFSGEIWVGWKVDFWMWPNQFLTSLFCIEIITFSNSTINVRLKCYALKLKNSYLLHSAECTLWYIKQPLNCWKSKSGEGDSKRSHEKKQKVSRKSTSK